MEEEYNELNIVLNQKMLNNLETSLNALYYPIVQKVYHGLAECYSNKRTTEEEAMHCKDKYITFQETLSKQEKQIFEDCSIKSGPLSLCKRNRATLRECMMSVYEKREICATQKLSTLYRDSINIV
jgi:hypothetical protein